MKAAWHQAMFAACPKPVWRLDDFTSCFHRDILQTLLPLLSIGVSALFLAAQLVQGFVRRRRLAGYKSLPNGYRPFGLPTGDSTGEESEEERLINETDEDENEDEEGGLQQVQRSPAAHSPLIHRSTSRTNGSVREVDRPRAELILVVLEELAVTGEVLVHGVAFGGHAWGKKGQGAALAGLVTWLYIFALASLRLGFTTSSRLSFPKLWAHTTWLYCLQFIFSLLTFRSALIHPRAGRAEFLLIIDFFLVSVLTLIAITTRKGNRAVVVEYENGLQPSKEPLASLFSLATFSWVNSIVWTGYKRALELTDVWNLAPEDKAAFVLQEFRQARKSTRLLWRLLRHFRVLLLVQAAWAAFTSVFIFVPTLLLKAILEYVEHPENTPLNAAWFYVVLLLVSGCAQAIGDAQALWIGRKICIRLRAAIIGEIYDKALRRKAASRNESPPANGKGKMRPPDGRITRRVRKMISFGRRKRTELRPDEVASRPTPADSQANTGTIINLMAVDSFKVSEASAFLHFVWAGLPVQMTIAIVLLYRILGYSSIAGVLMVILLLPVNVLFARQFNIIQKRIMGATDERIHMINEVLQSIRIIKYFAWERRFNSLVDEKRSRELKRLRHRYTLWAFAATVWYGVPIMITFASFFVYTKIEGRELIPSVAFTSLSLFNILRTPLDQFADMLAHVQESKVSVDRVEKFLNEEETEKYSHVRHDVDEDEQPLILLDGATCSWGPRDQDPEDDTASFRLIDLNVQFYVGRLNVIVGPTGSGKSSLLMALLGEMTLIHGSIYAPGGQSRESCLRDPQTGLTESIAYCAQQAWLINDTIKQNILFASSYEEARYKNVIHTCALERDLEILDASDNTLVGEKGITLSGGQKQRISLARALYSRCRHVFLDDCLSAVDSHTAKWIFDYCVMGPLMYGRTCILVTHNVALCVPSAHQVVVLENGKTVAHGPPLDVMTSGALGEDLQKSRPTSRGTSRMPSRTPSEVSSGETMVGAAQSHAYLRKRSLSSGERQPEPVNMAEGKTEGKVHWRVILLYLRAMGPWYFWVAAFIIFVSQQLGSLASNVWIRQWANAYAEHQTASEGTGALRQGDGLIIQDQTKPAGFLGISSAEVNPNYYLGVYASIGGIYLLISLMREGVLFGGSLVASWKIHRRLLDTVTRARFRFFDQTPLGQLMNRFSRDIEAVDQEISPAAIGFAHSLASVTMVTILISIITPGFLVAGFFIALVYFFIGKFYIRSSRDLKRLEAVQRSPLYQQFSETLSGVTTIRAYGDEERFIRDNLNKVNSHNRPFIYLWAANRWLSLRVDVTGAFVSFFAGAFVILSVGTIDAGAAGLSMTYAVTFTENVLWLVRLYSVNEQNMNSIERIKEYLEVEQEAEAIVYSNRPAANWPSQGSVQFINYSTRYRSDLDLVLKNVSLNILPLEKIGIVGRTGAGKSSLALALFRGLEAEEGKILIDNVDIGLIGLQDLRESITIVPQGTIRSNLDPFDMFTDEQIFETLRRVHLIGGSGSATPQPQSRPSSPSPVNKNAFLNLSSPVTEAGNNLSQGQRQLLCLARAMLKSPKVLLMDEATASIDYATDAKIQGSIRELQSTIITVAHRLQTIIDYDKVLVLDRGEVKEFEHPWQLLNPDREGGPSLFRGMCEMSGELDTLEEASRRAWDARVS